MGSWQKTIFRGMHWHGGEEKRKEIESHVVPLSAAERLTLHDEIKNMQLELGRTSQVLTDSRTLSRGMCAHWFCAGCLFEEIRVFVAMFADWHLFAFATVRDTP